jgi:hypothetical protein
LLQTSREAIDHDASESGVSLGSSTFDRRADEGVELCRCEKALIVELVLNLQCKRGVAIGAHPATQAVSDGVVS